LYMRTELLIVVFWQENASSHWAMTEVCSGRDILSCIFTFYERHPEESIAALWKISQLWLSWSQFPISVLQSLPHAGVQTSSWIQEDNWSLTRHWLQFLWITTRNIHSAMHITWSQCQRVTFSAGRIVDVVLIFGRIFSVHILVIKYPWLWNERY
jgi:hypothetical protein